MNEYIHILFVMPTTVHLPGDLLRSIDERAKEMGVSRNRYIVRALKKAIDEETNWSPAFLRTLEEAARDKDSHPEIDDMVAEISSHRTKKSPPKF